MAKDRTQRLTRRNTGRFGWGWYHYPRTVPHVHKHPRAGYQNSKLCRFWALHDLINLAQNLDCYDFYPGIDSEEALGRAYIEEMEMLDVPDNVLPYFDFEAYGRDVRINEGGHFAPGGYVFNNGGSFVERYHGMEDIPPEHRIFAYPKLNIREQMAAYQEVIDRSALNEEKLRLPTSREDR